MIGPPLSAKATAETMPPMRPKLRPSLLPEWEFRRQTYRSELFPRVWRRSPHQPPESCGHRPIRWRDLSGPALPRCLAERRSSARTWEPLWLLSPPKGRPVARGVATPSSSHRGHPPLSPSRPSGVSTMCLLVGRSRAGATCLMRLPHRHLRGHRRFTTTPQSASCLPRCRRRPGKV